MAFAGVAWWLRRTRAYATPRLKPRGPLLTANEREFLQRLRTALPELDVFPQVSMGAIIAVDAPESHPLYWPVRGQFDRKVVDFCVCCQRTSAVLCLVELDDRTHDFAKDARRDDVPASAGIETLRFWSRNKPSTREIRERVMSLTKFNAAR